MKQLLIGIAIAAAVVGFAAYDLWVDGFFNSSACALERAELDE